MPTANRTRKPKVRNYSFAHSKRLPNERMTEINGVRIPSTPGSCYHAVICALAAHKEQIVFWDRIFELTEKYIKQFGGPKAWEKFVAKKGVKTVHQRIKDNTHTLTRTGKDCYGYRLHEQGTAIYFFKDGAMLLTGGKFVKSKDGYNVQFNDGRGLQVRYRGTTMTSKEYKKFWEEGFITGSGKILQAESIARARRDANKQVSVKPIDSRIEEMPVIVTLVDTFDQNTAMRLEMLGLVVEQAEENQLSGTIPSNKLVALQNDTDVVSVQIN